MRETCPDCETTLLRIQVLDRGYMDSTHEGLMYSDPTAKKGFFGNFKTAGTVQALMCGDCGRVLFYAEPSA